MRISKSAAAAHRAAVIHLFCGPTAQEKPAAEPSGAGCSKGDEPPLAKLVRTWPATLDGHDPWGDGSTAAAARVADMAAAAEARSGAARLRSYPLPRRTSLAQMRKAMAARLRAARKSFTVGCEAYLQLYRVRKDVVSLQGSSGALMQAAHSAGLSWVTTQAGQGLGPPSAAALAWCAEFVEVSASVHGADVQAHATVMPSNMLEGGLDKLEGGRPASPLLLLLDWSQAAASAAMVVWDTACCCGAEGRVVVKLQDGTTKKGMHARYALSSQKISPCRAACSCPGQGDPLQGVGRGAPRQGRRGEGRAAHAGRAPRRGSLHFLYGGQAGDVQDAQA